MLARGCGTERFCLRETVTHIDFFVYRRLRSLLTYFLTHTLTHTSSNENFLHSRSFAVAAPTTWNSLTFVTLTVPPYLVYTVNSKLSYRYIN